MNTDDMKQTGRDKLQDYGREGLAPLLELFNRYGNEIVHYMRHLNEGLATGGKRLRETKAPGEDQECPERDLVATWFEEGSKWVDQLEAQLEKGNTNDLLSFIETQGRQHPAALFATSILAGSVFGAVGKQAYKSRPSTASQNYSESQNANRNI